MIEKIVKPEAVRDETIVSFAGAMKAPLFVAQLLTAFKITDTEAARSFFLAAQNEPYDSYLLHDMDKAVAVVMEALEEGSRIAIHGDYDVDGITGTALLFRGLKECGFSNITWYLPNRFSDGYGVSIPNIQKLYDEGARTIVTVDTGITAYDELAFAKNLGMKVVVLDHHQEGDESPDVDAVVNPHKSICSYPFNHLSGVGVAYKLLTCVADKLNIAGLDKYLEFVALGTLADMVSVLGENRIFIKHGMRQMFNSSFPGVAALVAEAALDAEYPSSKDLLYKVTPLINAAGRVGKPDKALELLISETAAEAQSLMAQLKTDSALRRSLDQQVTEEAIAQVEGNPELIDAKVLVVWGEQWAQGVLGIAAIKLVNRFNRPVSVLSIGDDGVAVASARSIGEFDWHQALEKSKDLLERWGGHKMAAGYSIKRENLEAFRRSVNECASEAALTTPEFNYIKPHVSLTFDEINEETMRWLQRFEPFGTDNALPLFYSKNVSVGYECRVVGESHLKIELSQRGVSIPCIGFGLGHLCETLNDVGHASAIAYSVTWNRFRGRRTIQLQLIAIEI
ncbi:MAG: single-stranded-DNA-specific exonuclease RecJ [Fibrobacterales bacterium]